MSRSFQRTISKEVTVTGTGVHSGETVSLTFRPAEPGSGIRFRRLDMDGSPEIPADVAHVVDTDRGTGLGEGEAKILTVEHVLAALVGLSIDNVLLEVEGPEVPICDGSFHDYVAALDEAGPVDQAEEAEVLTLSGVVQVGEGDERSSYVAMPGNGLRISATIDFEHPVIGRQYGSFLVDEDGFRSELARARTFGFKADADALHSQGLALGTSLENAVVLDDEGVMNDDLRFDDEFLRHKVGDIVGDLALLGARLDAHIVAERPSHRGNVALVKAIRTHLRRSGPPIADIARVMEFLPHRYPMLLVDRIIDQEPGHSIVGIKNVTINEPFFQGHFPGHPIMPGVLILEAMAQCGGLLLMDKVEKPDDKVVYFMTMDKVKFRRPVIPGDTLVLELEVVQFRRQVCRMKGRALVDGHVVAEGEFMAGIMDK
ncbi:MAG: UDP-3-O-[3-hydroxymyristoyl] N-acetylglucosamine deacetylase [Gemmatimonadetes bacterium]|nr:UDP-3-O-[3-hydroxymyristoyl] N-acetylglucosamine deacetylase [Gemmatimonadota bacterium]